MPVTRFPFFREKIKDKSKLSKRSGRSGIHFILEAKFLEVKKGIGEQGVLKSKHLQVIHACDPSQSLNTFESFNMLGGQ